MLNKLFSWFEQRINPYPQELQPVHETRLIPFIFSCLQGVKKWIAVLIVFIVGLGIFEAFLFQMLSMIVDWLAEETPESLMADKSLPFLLMAAALAVSPLWTLISSNIRFQTVAGPFPMRLRWRFHRLMLAQSMRFFQDEFAGRVSAKVMQTALAVREVSMVVADMVVYIVVYLATTTVILVHFHPLMLLPFVFWLAAFSVTLVFFVPRLAKSAQMQADARSLMTGRITDAYANIMTVKLFSHTEREAEYAKSAMQEFMKTVYTQMRLVSGLDVTNYAINMLMIGSTVALGVWLWQDSAVTVGAVAAATTMALRLNGLSQWLMWQSAMLFEQIGTVKDGINTLSRPHAVTDAPDAAALQVTRGDIVFDHVRFAYSGKAPLFEDFSLHIRAGEKIGIVGRSGAGKSSIVNMLLRFYDIDGGTIRIDGQNIAHVTQNSLRAAIGMVTQDTSLLHRSVRENIAYGKPDASEEEIRHAARRAQADSFIPQLTDKNGRSGYDALVGERGIKLSGGQRQRIAIARVMLKNAPILLLDEATSALDSEVETAIQESLYRLMEGKTVIAIAHRLSTIAAMDRLVVLDKGRIVESGTHAALLAQNGLYAKLWAHQSGGFLPEQLDNETEKTS